MTHIRNVALLPGEQVTHLFSPRDGLVKELPADDRVLVTTNQRIISFSQDHGHSETSLVPIEELRGVVVKSNTRSPFSWVQGLLLLGGGILVYLVVAYWLAGRFSGPNVPVIDVDLGPLIIMLVIAWTVFLLGRHYFLRNDGAATFQASNWSFTFPYQGRKAQEEMYQVVNALFILRRSRNGYPFLWEE